MSGCSFSKTSQLSFSKKLRNSCASCFGFISNTPYVRCKTDRPSENLSGETSQDREASQDRNFPRQSGWLARQGQYLAASQYFIKKTSLHSRFYICELTYSLIAGAEGDQQKNGHKRERTWCMKLRNNSLSCFSRKKNFFGEITPVFFFCV